MGTEMLNNNSYYNGRGTGGPNTNNNNYIQYSQPLQEVSGQQSQNNPGNDMNSSSDPRGSQTNLYNNHTWIPTSSSSSSDNNSSPSSSSMASGNYGPSYRYQSNSNYYLQHFGHPKSNWEFMSHVQRQIHENCGYNSNEMGHSSSTPSSSSLSSVTSSSSTSQANSCGQAQYSGGSHKKSAGQHSYYLEQQQQSHQQQHQQNMQQQHYANTLHYHQQQMLQLASGSLI